MNSSNYQDVIASADQLLSADRARHKSEGNVQSDIEALLREMNLGTSRSAVSNRRRSCRHLFT